MTFQLIGNFPGDEEKKEKVARLEKVLGSSANTALSLEQIVDVLHDLPHSGRLEFMLKPLSASPHRDDLVRRLFYWCFEAGGSDGTIEETDDDFVLVGCNSTTFLNAARSYIMACVVSALPKCSGSLCVELFEAYKKTTSRVYRPQLLRCVVRCTEFSDGMLLETFQDSTMDERKDLVKTCKGVPFRASFLSLLMKQGLVETQEVIYWTPPEEMKAAILAPKATELSQEAVVATGFCNWNKHGETYLEYLRQKLRRAGDDVLHKGNLYEQFEAKLREEELTSEHVEALVHICREYNVMEITPGHADVEGEVSNFLWKLSREGKLSLEYRALQSVCPSKKILKRVVDRQGFLNSLLQRNANGEMGIKSGYVTVFVEMLNHPLTRRTSAISERGDFISQVFRTTSSSTFWLYLLGKRPRTPEMDLFKAVVAHARERLEDTKSNRSTQTLVDAWIELHRQNVPDSATVAWAAAEDDVKTPLSGYAGESFLWSQWMESATSILRPVISRLLAKATRIHLHTDYTQKRSGLSLYLGFAAQMIDNVEIAMGPPRDFVGRVRGGKKQESFEREVLVHHVKELNKVLKLLAPHKVLLDVRRPCPAIDAFRSHLSTVVTDRVVPSLAKLLCVFDVHNEAYLEKSAVDICMDFLNLMRSEQLIVLLTRGAAWGHQAVDFVQDYLSAVQLTEEQRSKGFFVSESAKDGRRSFRHFSEAKHTVKKHHAENTLLLLLEHLGSNERNEKYAQNDYLDAVALKAWSVYKVSALGREIRRGVTLYDALQQEDSEVGEHNQARKDFVSTVSKQRRAVVQSEELAILAIVARLPASRFNLGFESQLRQMRLSEKFYLQNKDADGMAFYLVELLSGTCALSNDDNGFRNFLESKTRGKDMHDRIGGHLRLLEASACYLECTGYPGESDMKPFIRSLEFVASRIKNEAGLVRPQIYVFLERHAGKMVQSTLSQETEELAISTATTLTKLLEGMLKDDVGKRDSVAKNTFQAIGRQVMMQALYTPGSPVLALHAKRIAVRKIWIECSIRLDFIVMRKNTGEQSWKDYVWHEPVEQAQHPLWSEKLVDLPKVLRVARDIFGPGGEVTVKQRACREANKEKTHFSPLSRLECAELLRDALEAVKAAELAQQPSLDFLLTPMDALPPIDPNFEDDERSRWSHASSSVFKRMEYLARLCGPMWTECQPLRDFLALAVQNAKTWRETNVPKQERVSHLQRCMDFYRVLVSNHSGTRYSPLLKEASYQFMTEAVCPTLGLNAISRELARRWLKAQSAEDGAFEDLNHVERQFLLQHVGSQKRQSRSLAEFKEKEAVVQVEAVKHLLFAVSLSAIHVDEVRTALVRRRDDVLERFVGAPCKDFWGALRKVNPHESDKPDDAYNIVLHDKEVRLLNGTCSRRHSELSLKRAMVAGASVNVRAEAVSRYVQSPSTTHEDVVRLLKTLLPNSDDSALVEAVVLSVFRTDGAWHVLSFLLSPEGLASSAQRTAAKVLSNMCAWAPPAAAVRVMVRLLAPDKRGSLKILMHKNIVRELAASGLPQAQEALLAEWRNRDKLGLHEDIQHEIVRLMLGQVTDGTRRQSGEAVWHILREASDPHQCHLQEVQLLFTRMHWVPVRRTDVVTYSPPSIRLAAGDSIIPYAKQRGSKSIRDRDENFRQLVRKRDEVEMSSVCSCSIQFKRGQIEEEPSAEEHNNRIKTYCAEMKAANERISVGAQNELVRILATGAKFTFDWSGATGNVSEASLEDIFNQVMKLQPAEESDASGPLHDLEAPEQYLVTRLMSVYMSYVMQTLTMQESVARKYTDVDRSKGFARADLVETHFAAQHHGRFCRRVLDGVLDTPLRQARLRQFLVVVGKGLMSSDCLPSDWREDLVLKRHGDLLDYLHQESENLSLIT